MPGLFVIISHGRIKAGKIEDFKAYAERFLSGVEEREPRILVFSTYVDEAGEHYTLVQVHPDAESMEQHMEVMAEEIGAAFEYVESGGVEVYGEPSDAVLAMMRNIVDVPVTLRPSGARRQHHSSSDCLIGPSQLTQGTCRRRTGNPQTKTASLRERFLSSTSHRRGGHLL